VADQQHPYGHDFNDTRPGDQGNQQNLLHAIRGGVMGGNEYRVQNMPRSKGYRVSAQALTANVPYAAAFDAAEYDTDSMWSATTPSRLTCKTPGVYSVIGEAIYDMPGTANGWTRIVLNSGTALAAFTDTGAVAGFACEHNLGCHWVAQKNDFIELWMTSSSANNIIPGQYNVYLAACMISTL
jgi:hypothetical protein